MHIQYEKRHPISSTMGCFDAHVKAIASAIRLMNYDNNIDYVIIGEEDLYINNVDNIRRCLRYYNKDSRYILHLGGFPDFSTNINNIIHNINDNNLTLKSRIYLTTAYAINRDIAVKLWIILTNSSNHIHCDAIISHSKIEQRLVKGNCVNQLSSHTSNNTIIHNYLSTKNITRLYLLANKFSIFFIEDDTLLLILMQYSWYYKNYLVLFIEVFNYMNVSLSYLLVSHNYNKCIHKNFFTYLECTKLSRIYTLYCIVNSALEYFDNL